MTSGDGNISGGAGAGAGAGAGSGGSGRGPPLGRGAGKKIGPEAMRVTQAATASRLPRLLPPPTTVATTTKLAPKSISCQIGIDLEAQNEKKAHANDNRRYYHHHHPQEDDHDLDDSDMYTDIDTDADGPSNSGRKAAQRARVTGPRSRNRSIRNPVTSDSGYAGASHSAHVSSSSSSSSSSAAAAAAAAAAPPSSVLVEVPPSPSPSSSPLPLPGADTLQSDHNNNKPSSSPSTFGSRLAQNLSAIWAQSSTAFHSPQQQQQQQHQQPHRPHRRCSVHREPSITSSLSSGRSTRQAGAGRGGGGGGGTRKPRSGAGVRDSTDGDHYEDSHDQTCTQQQTSMARPMPAFFFGTARNGASAGAGVGVGAGVGGGSGDGDGEGGGDGGGGSHDARHLSSFWRNNIFKNRGGGAGGGGGGGAAAAAATATYGGLKYQTRQQLKKFDEKALFSNERTYLHWIKFGMLLGSMALTLLSFGDHKSVGFPVGMFLVLVAMATLAYATAMFHCRDQWMRLRRTDRLYYDRVGPSLLFAALFLAYATNVILTVNRITEMMDDDRHTFLGNTPRDPVDI
ncbi:hypothetical protein DFQ27_002178 [Actinomortierella ambigua]|uniref:DUF202 domain-containing protein n=1 Tax=Actinomortierella ambigua TaxID=1343610 RepID=A0A9P6UCT0_9FUNG|nr:hypothetical protein DFQ27_002178 [Actinomortierella ambigua]